MKVKELKQLLNQFNPEAKVFLSSDEEMNSLYQTTEVSYLNDSDTEKRTDRVVLWGYDEILGEDLK